MICQNHLLGWPHLWWCESCFWAGLGLMVGHQGERYQDHSGDFCNSPNPAPVRFQVRTGGASMKRKGWIWKIPWKAKATACPQIRRILGRFPGLWLRWFGNKFTEAGKEEEILFGKWGVTGKFHHEFQIALHKPFNIHRFRRLLKCYCLHYLKERERERELYSPRVCSLQLHRLDFNLYRPDSITINVHIPGRCVLLSTLISSPCSLDAILSTFTPLVFLMSKTSCCVASDSAKHWAQTG